MKVSVFLVTYNQEQYIRQALNSIVMQQVNFDYEVIVGEDCSTDATPTICDEYAATYPQIKVYHHNPNKGLLGNWEFVMNKCQGEYIALLEGDDYWIDTHKLQKQVDFLDMNPQYSLCFTSADISMEFGGQIGAEQSLRNIREGEYTSDDIFGKPLSILTSTVVLRNCILPIRYSGKLLYADYYTFMMLLQKGNGYGFSVPMSVYRLHANNMSGHDVNFYKKKYSQDKFFSKIFPQYKEYFKQDMYRCLQHLIYDMKYGWKYRLIYMLHNPKLLFSSFLLTTFNKYLLRIN